jgi:hypothetical protein
MEWEGRIKSRLDELRRKRLGLRLTEGAWRFVAGLALLALAAALLEFAFHFPPVVRLPLFAGMLAASAAALMAWNGLPLIRHAFRPTPLHELALLWGRSLQQVNDRLLNALQVWEKRSEAGASPELADLALTSIAKELQGASYQGILQTGKRRQLRQWALAAVSLWVVAGVFTGGSVVGALGRILQPSRDFGPPQPFALIISDAPNLAIRGEPLPISVLREARDEIGIAPLPERAALFFREDNSPPGKLTAPFDAQGRAGFSIENPQRDLAIWAAAQGISSDTARVEIKSRPFIKDLQVRWFPPAYSKLPAASAMEKRGDVSALKGSRVRISLEADRELTSSQFLLFSDASPDSPRTESMDLQGKQANHEFDLTDNGHYNLVLTDRDDIRSAAPVDYNLWVIPDERPTIQIIYPPEDAELNESLIIPLKAQARDDFAISRIRLGYQLKKGSLPDSVAAEPEFQWQSVSFDALGEGNYIVDHLWDLNSLNLLPGDEIRYRLEALDNDAVSGPKAVLSPVQRLRFPTLEEIFTRMDEGQGEQMQDAQETLDRSKALKKELDALQEELKRSPDLSWEERKKVEEMLKTQEEMARQIQQMSQQTEQMIQKMEENRLLSAETMQKFMELQKLMGEVMTPELLAAMQKLQEALQKQDPQEIQRAVEEFSLNQEEFLKKIEKTMNILKQLQMEMKLDELAKRAEQLLEKQQDINKDIENAPEGKERPEEAASEAALQKEMEAFEREFQEAQEQLKESPYNPEQAMKAADSLLQANEFPQTMEQMSGDLQQGSNSGAKQKGSKIQSGLAQLSAQMKQAKEQMTSAAKQELAQELQKIASELLELSHRQEALLDTSLTMDRASPRFRQQAQEQQNLRTYLEKSAQDLFKLSQKSFFITPQMGSAVDQAFRGMDQALIGYTARNPQSVQNQQQGAMGGLNRAVMEINQSLNQLSSSSSSTGFSEMMEQLSKMAGQQGQINQGTMALIPGGTNPGSLSLQQQAAMSRLAAEQGALQQALEDWNQANQQTSQMMGRLGELGKEMQEVVKDLQNRQVDQRTLKRQEQILTRLLDAQRSVREREYKKERISRTAQGDYFKPSPGQADENLGPDVIREQMLKALKEGYTREYQQLIRDYFEALARERQ